MMIFHSSVQHVVDHTGLVFHVICVEWCFWIIHIWLWCDSIEACWSFQVNSLECSMLRSNNWFELVEMRICKKEIFLDDVNNLREDCVAFYFFSNSCFAEWPLRRRALKEYFWKMPFSKHAAVNLCHLERVKNPFMRFVFRFPTDRWNETKT